MNLLRTVRASFCFSKFSTFQSIFYSFYSFSLAFWNSIRNSSSVLMSACVTRLDCTKLILFKAKQIRLLKMSFSKSCLLNTSTEGISSPVVHFILKLNFSSAIGQFVILVLMQFSEFLVLVQRDIRNFCYWSSFGCLVTILRCLSQGVLFVRRVRLLILRRRLL